MKKQPKRVPLWLPYLQAITNKGDEWTFEYNGGEEITKLDSVQSIMIYGDSDTSLEVGKIDKIVRKGIPIIIHRRNLAQPIYITGGERPDPDDTIYFQVMKQHQSRTTTHIARQLLLAKMDSMKWLIDPLPLPKFASVEKLRNIEAQHAKKYWQKWFAEIGHPEWTRRGKNPASAALDAHSKFIHGIILRWIAYHHLSPYHGFLHVQNTYPSLIYDLMEPYRGIFEQRLLHDWKRGGVKPEKYLTSGIAITKDLLNEQSYVPLTRQIVTNQEMLHGIVLSLKFYLLGKQRKFLVPLPGKPNGGRPPKVKFLMYGRHAGKTDFWRVAKSLSNKK